MQRRGNSGNGRRGQKRKWKDKVKGAAFAAPVSFFVFQVINFIEG